MSQKSDRADAKEAREEAKAEAAEARRADAEADAAEASANASTSEPSDLPAATPESPPPAGTFDNRLQHEKQTLDPALADVRNEASVSVNTAPAGGFDAPVAGAGPFHTPDPEGAVEAAAGTTKILPADPVPAVSLARPRAGEATAVEVDPSNKPLPDGHAKTVVPRNPAHTERVLTTEENEMEAIRRDQAALNERVAALSARTGL